MFEKTEKLTLKIEGMSCEHCVKKVFETLKAVKGVKKAEVSLSEKNAVVTYVPSKTGREAMASAICAAGFKAE